MKCLWIMDNNRMCGKDVTKGILCDAHRAQGNRGDFSGTPIDD